MTTQKNKNRRLEDILKKFNNIPENRLTVNPQNLKWFIRSGAAYNLNQPRILEALTLAKDILNEDTQNGQQSAT